MIMNIRGSGVRDGVPRRQGTWHRRVPRERPIPVIILLALASVAHAAETLPAVSPPTDWFGVAVVIGIGLAIFLPIAYAIYVKLKTGTQPGEDAINKLLDALNKSHTTIQTQAAALEAHAVAQPKPTTVNWTPPSTTTPPAKFPADWT